MCLVSQRSSTIKIITPLIWHNIKVINCPTQCLDIFCSEYTNIKKTNEHLLYVLQLFQYTNTIHLKTMFDPSLPTVVCRRAHVLFTLFAFVCVKWCPTHIYSYCVPCVSGFSGLSLRYSLTFIERHGYENDGVPTLICVRSISYVVNREWNEIVSTNLIPIKEA